MNVFEPQPAKELNRKKFKVIRGDMFSKGSARDNIMITLWPTSISFNKAAVKALNGCERIRIEVNVEDRQILVTSVTEKDKDNVRWTKNVKDPSPKKLECKEIVRQLYSEWKWNSKNNYRAEGRVITLDNKVMLLFDLQNPENWVPKGRGK